MPMHLPDSTWLQSDLGGAQLVGYRKLVDIDDLYAAARSHRVGLLLAQLVSISVGRLPPLAKEAPVGLQRTCSAEGKI